MTFQHDCLNSLIFSFLSCIPRQERDEAVTAMTTALFLLAAFFLLAERMGE